MSKAKTLEYEKRYADVKRKLHAVVYGGAEYKAMRQLLDYYYIKKQGR